MASIVLLLSELVGGAESTSVLAANWYMSGHSLRDFRPAGVAKGERPPAGAKQAADAEERRKEAEKGESFEDLAVSRIAVDVMWP